MSNISLEAAVRTCKVNTGWAPRIQSDRFENSNLMMCPVWTQRDLTGRKVSEDSFWTKREGCNSPLDRIDVENDQRPQYMEYITLDSAGFRGDMYDQTPGVELPSNPNMPIPSSVPSSVPNLQEKYIYGMEKDMSEHGSSLTYDQLNNVHNLTGQFGMVTGFRQNIEGKCDNYPYEYAMAHYAQQMRNNQAMSQASISESYRKFY